MYDYGSTYLFAILAWGAVLGLIPAFIARSKGRSFGTWYLYGFMLFIVALIHSVVIQPDQRGVERQRLQSGMQKCSYCAEFIQAEAKVCRYCQREVAQKIVGFRDCAGCGARAPATMSSCWKCGQLAAR